LLPSLCLKCFARIEVLDRSRDDVHFDMLPFFNNYSDQYINDIMWTCNTTPRKCLDFLTPLEALVKSMGVALEFESSPYSSVTCFVFSLFRLRALSSLKIILTPIQEITVRVGKIICIYLK
jgi:hypothetical protein